MSFVDQFHDPAFGVLVREASRRPALAEFVKEASVESDEAAALPDTAFAWSDCRLYPIHTEKHAALSRVYAEASGAPSFVLEAIKTACEVYGIAESTFTPVATKIAEADPEDAYLLPGRRLFAVRQASDVKVAEQRVLSNLTRLDLESRATVCGNLVKKAAEYGVQLHPRVEALAGFVVSSTRKTADWLDARAGQAKADAHRLAYQKLAADLRTRPEEMADRDGLLKLASVVAELDEASGLDRHYDRKLPDALQTVFNTDKIAAEHLEVNGRLLSLKKLASLPSAFWEELGGRELADELSGADAAKIATVVGTLPLDLKVTLAAYCRG